MQKRSVKFLIMAAALCLCVMVSACGKRGPLEAPPGGNQNYPAKYPKE